MAVAVKDSMETTPGRPLLDRLVLGSVVGAVYVLACLVVLFYGLPNLWSAGVASWLVPTLGTFLSSALLMLTQLAAAAGLIYFGQRLLGNDPPHGIRAGIAVCIVGFLAIGLLTWAIGSLMERYWLVGEGNRLIGLIVTAVVGVALLVGGFYLLLQPGSTQRLVMLEDQGWFSRATYKKSQGVRVRRGTIIGILAIAGSGIWVLINRGTLSFGPPNDWALLWPFTQGAVRITLLPEVRFTVPILLAILSLWLAFRIVNYPLFADFLIATEAELNKVSWTSRKRLFQDTIVVLTTVILLTIFLFVIDIAWGWLLSQKYVGVLRIDAEQVQKQQPNREQPW